MPMTSAGFSHPSCRRKAACLPRLPLFFFQAEDGIRDWSVTGVQTCALPISPFPAAFDRFHMGIQDEAAHRFHVELLAAAALASAALIARSAPPAFPPPIQVAGKIGRASCRERV